MLTLALAYALIGFVTLTIILSLVDLMAEPEQGITLDCVVLVVAFWPLIWAKVAFNVASAAFDDLRVPARKWISSFSRQPQLLSERFASQRGGKLARRQSMS